MSSNPWTYLEKPVIERLGESMAIREKYPDRIPVVLLPQGNHVWFERHRYLARKDQTFSQFVRTISSYSKGLSPDQTLFYLIHPDGIFPMMMEPIHSIWSRYRHPDGYLYLVYCLENTFG